MTKIIENLIEFISLIKYAEQEGGSTHIISDTNVKLLQEALVEAIQLNKHNTYIGANTRVDVRGMEHNKMFTSPAASPIAPYKCPVCCGSGELPNGFYHRLGGGTAMSTAPEICRSCKNTGVLWRTPTIESSVCPSCKCIPGTTCAHSWHYDVNNEWRGSL